MGVLPSSVYRTAVAKGRDDMEFQGVVHEQFGGKEGWSYGGMSPSQEKRSLGGAVRWGLLRGTECIRPGWWSQRAQGGNVGVRAKWDISRCLPWRWVRSLMIQCLSETVPRLICVWGQVRGRLRLLTRSQQRPPGCKQVLVPVRG